MRGHGHDGHPVGGTAIDGLQPFVIKGLGQHDLRDRVDNFAIGNRPMVRDAGLGVLVIFATEAHQEVCHGLSKEFVLLRIPFPESSKLLRAQSLEFGSLGLQSVCLEVIDRTHERLGNRRNRS